jgi:hypothetical protein
VEVVGGWVKNRLLRLCLKEAKEGEDLTESGIAFQTAGAAYRKARAPKSIHRLQGPQKTDHRQSRLSPVKPRIV